MKRLGFTTIELILVIAVFAIVVSLSSISFSGISLKSPLDSSARDIVQLVRVAESNAISRYRNSQWGVHIDASVGKITLFAGTSYAARDPQFDLLHSLSGSLKLENIAVTGGGQDIVFQRSDGTTQQPGSFEIVSTSGDRYRFTVNGLGQINFQRI